MGQHYVNGTLVGDAVLDPARPEAVIYEPKKNGGSKLVGVEWVVFQSAWEDAGNAAPPTLFGRTLKLVPAPNRYGIPAFYQIHAWVWKHNPSGSFSDWNPTRLLPLRSRLSRDPLGSVTAPPRERRHPLFSARLDSVGPADSPPRRPAGVPRDQPCHDRARAVA